MKIETADPQSPSYVYLDSSVYLHTLLEPKHAGEVTKQLERRALCSSTLLTIEVERNLVRLSREGLLKEAHYADAMQRFRDDISLFTLKELTLDICLSGTYPAVKTPRASDLAHLRTALWFHRQSPLYGFMTFDTHQKEAAIELGLPLFPLH